MKAKLHKMVSGYILSLNGDIDDPYAIVNEELAKDYEWYKLSLKNCQEIERGYDLDELAMGYDLYENINFVGQMRAYKAGFQKALELNNTKHYTLEDMMNCWNKALTFQNHKELFGYHIQSLRQNKWDVEIVMECPQTGCDIECDIDCYEPNKKPKFDSDGCLILKKIIKMEQRSTHYGDVSKWIEKVIDSCETYQQTFTALKLVSNFAKQLRTKTPDKYWNSYQYTVIEPLQRLVKIKRQEISFINKIEE